MLSPPRAAHSCRHELRQAAASPEDVDKLDASQLAAAGAIAGTGGLVAITGPAGAGKTTMLRVAHAGLRGQRRRMLVVAPTRKAASVASREVGAAASSLHALLADHGYRWNTDAAGAQVWTRLSFGEADPDDWGRLRRAFAVRAPTRRSDRRGRGRHGRPADRGRARRSRAPNSGSAWRWWEIRTRRFRSGTRERWHPQCASRQHPSNSTPCTGSAIPSTPRSRFVCATPATATTPSLLRGSCSSAGTCNGCGARRKRATRWLRPTSSGTRAGSGWRWSPVRNGEADAINDAIQQRRVDDGELDATVLALGMGEQRILVGDTVQTRRNDPRTGVENRAQWVVREIRDDEHHARVGQRQWRDPSA